MKQPGLEPEVILRARVIWALSLAALFVGGRAVLAQYSASRPDLQGRWNGSTRTPLQRPQQFMDRSKAPH